MPAGSIDGSAITADDKRHALESALESATFARSPQLRTFLSFVCEWDLRGRGEPLTEYQIGVEALGRPAGYFPGEDSAVRTRAYELRHKLEKLYSTELKNQPLEIFIPKGSYAPQFVVRHAGPPAADSAPVSQGRWARFLPVGLALIACAAVGFGFGRFTRESATPVVDPVVSEAWARFDRSPSGVVLCAATPLSFIAPGFPAMYQVVVQCTFSDLSLLSYRYQTHRVLKD